MSHPFDWHLPNTWNAICDPVFEGFEKPTDQDKLNRIPIDDGIVWREVYEKASNQDIEDAIKFVSDRLFSATLNAYHGCRPLDPSSYEREGMMLYDEESIRRYAVEVISRTEIPKGALASTLDELDELITGSYWEPRIFFGLDYGGLLDWCGHYLIYGSELICAAMGPFQRELKSVGIPTIIRSEILPAELQENAIRELAEDIIEERTRLLCQHDSTARKIDFSVVLRSAIPAERTSVFFHPTRIEDPLQRHTWYHFRNQVVSPSSGALYEF